MKACHSCDISCNLWSSIFKPKYRATSYTACLHWYNILHNGNEIRRKFSFKLILQSYYCWVTHVIVFIPNFSFLFYTALAVLSEPCYGEKVCPFGYLCVQSGVSVQCEHMCNIHTCYNGALCYVDENEKAGCRLYIILYMLHFLSSIHVIHSVTFPRHKFHIMKITSPLCFFLHFLITIHLASLYSC